MTTIYLIRHGQKQPHVGDPGLTDEGIRQAQETGEYLSQYPIRTLVSSPFKRTRETAQHIAFKLGLESTVHDALVERMNWSDPTVTRQQFFQEWVKSTHDRQYVPKWGDSSLSTGQRIERLISELVTDDEHVALVTHGGAIIDYLRNVVGDGQLSKLKTSFDEGDDYRMMNCAINTVVLSAIPTLELLNFIDHLSAPSE